MRSLMDSAPSDQLYEELLSTISRGDHVQEVSRLLCRGSPLEPRCGRSALRLAITNDRARTVSLLLASGASLSASLLQEAWYSTNVTPPVLASLTSVSSSDLPCLCPALLHTVVVPHTGGECQRGLLCSVESVGKVRMSCGSVSCEGRTFVLEQPQHVLVLVLVVV
ncbi:hypothetical protein E2C01_060027 [Portunus trituberculatus]|uniref:Uncharacterized protein n=1 Tax=Portunus trituberculatus TaxID=210409 RepID=A0A5B7H7R9_PORTR|nr:hypothetical protein [Portunus trituberculatus]